ncbi:hypothetical protein GEV27_02530 [Aeromicrobium sp. S22]|uniref:DUF5667 domain-containing protein n=1 Tax=Aeromicrobium sp. S22 TaxID=2662029 RepID=UPI00129DBA6D|nr:DUF5667 domain-containing protein [Aeromicrobium sp. S22]MRK00390.1 hypothetical protein [Aeromicrobium sp. S22]
MIGRRSHDDAQSFDEAWGGADPRDEEIAALVAFAEALCAAAPVEPTAQFRSTLRAQLMTEATTVLEPMPGAARPAATPARPRSTRRRLAGLTAALVTSAGAVGLVASSASALPGEMLYPVKRTVESVELTALHHGDESRGSFQLGQAEERLTEARLLSDKGASDTLVADALDDFSSAASDGSARLFTAYADTREDTTVRRVNDFATAASVELSELKSKLPSQAGDAYAAATREVNRLASRASTLCSSCGSADVDPLVDVVSGLARDIPAPKKPAKDDAARAPDPAASPAPAAPGGTSPGGPATSPSRSAPTVPAPAAPTRSPSLSDVTDPLLGGLLGDEDQEGLVPGLLSGLLGGGRQ